MLESREFLDTISLFATGVTVITTSDQGQVHGMTANAMTSLSLNPMQIIISVAKNARMAAILAIGSNFTVSLLRENHDGISNHFAGAKRSDAPPPFRFIEWPAGVYLEHCIGAIGCTVVECYPGGDHWIVVGTIIALHQGSEPREPLLYFRSKYGHLEPHRIQAPARLDFDEGTPLMFYDPW